MYTTEEMARNCNRQHGIIPEFRMMMMIKMTIFFRSPYIVKPPYDGIYKTQTSGFFE
jgi:hypothetical protein